MKKYLTVISICFLISFGCIAQSNKLFSANQTFISDNKFKKIIVKKVLLSECYLKFNRFRLMEIYFFNEQKDKSKSFVRFNILGDYKTDYKYYGYFIHHGIIFFVKGNVPNGLFVRTKLIKKFAYLGGNENINLDNCPSWNFTYYNKRLSFLESKCDE